MTTELDQPTGLSPRGAQRRSFMRKVFFASGGAASGGEPLRPAYAASKAGINVLTRHVASRWGKEGVRCNAVAPGLVMGETQQQQGDQELQTMALQYARSPRLGEPADLAATVAFLFSDDAEWVSGQVWSVNGGMSLRD